MLMTPRYDGPAVLRIDVPLADPSVPLVRQRRRLADVLALLDDDQWAAASRCEQWSVQDVISHLIGTNQFWAASIASGVAGKPTRYLTSFDPVTTPALLVAGMRDMEPSGVLAQYVETSDALAGVVAGLDDVGWSMPAEAPIGHMAVRAVVLHALWDAWIHERDIVVPLGLPTVIEDDEVAACLLYATALGPAIVATNGSAREGRLTVRATDPDVSFVLDIGPTVVVRAGSAAEIDGSPCLTGDAVSLIEALGFRAPLDYGLDDDDRWLLGGLGDAFDVSLRS